MSLIYLDEDPWLKELENCEGLCNELAERVESLTNKGTASVIADIRIRLRQCDQQLNHLRTTLYMEDPRRTITNEERERRERQLESLTDRAKHIRSRFNSPRPQFSLPDENREALFSGSNIEAPMRDPSFDVNFAKEQHADIIAEQDRGLEALSKIISRQKNIAQSIDSEVSTQNEIVSNLTESIGHVGIRTERATSRTAALSTRDNTCGYWIVASLLFVAIIVVSAIP